MTAPLRGRPRMPTATGSESFDVIVNNREFLVLLDRDGDALSVRHRVIRSKSTRSGDVPYWRYLWVRREPFGAACGNAALAIASAQQVRRQRHATQQDVFHA